MYQVSRRNMDAPPTFCSHTGKNHPMAQWQHIWKTLEHWLEEWMHARCPVVPSEPRNMVFVAILASAAIAL